MKKQHFPKGWNQKRVKKLIAQLDARTDEEWVAADEAACAEQTVITVPTELLPDIRRLVASHTSGETNGKIKAPRKRRSTV